MGFDPGPGPIMPEPPGGFDPGIIQAILDALNTLLNLIQQVAQFFWNLIVALIHALVTVFRLLLKFLRHVWENYITKAVTWLLKTYQRVHDWIKRIIDPILKFVQKIKRWYDTHILPLQLRMIQIIQRIRRILGILRLFHIGWAAKLDNALADIQNRIEQTIAIVRGILNQIINTLALVLDPTLFIARNILGGTLLGNLGAVKRIFGYGDNRILSASEQATIQKQHSLYFTDTVKTHLQTLNTSGPTQDDQDNRKAARQALADATNASLPF